MSMLLYKGIFIEQTDNFSATGGLKDYLEFEIKILNKKAHLSEYLEVLKYIIDYVLDSKVAIYDQETIAYNSWLLQFVKSSSEYFLIWEANEDGNGFHPGVDYAIKTTTDQRE